MTVESNKTQKLWYGGGLKFLNKFFETGYKVLYLAIWLVSFFVGSAVYSALPTMLSVTYVYKALCFPFFYAF